MAAGEAPGLARRISRQVGLLLAAFGLAQGLSLARNALLGHSLSKGDFGVAATITLALQLTEVLSDIGVDRHLVQSSAGDDGRLQASAHALLAARGVMTALLLYFCAGPIAALFRIEEAKWAFQLAALAPLIRGFSHLDARRFQRRYDNRAFVVLEVVPQAAALALMFAALALLQGYAAVAAVIVAQAAITWGLSLALSERSYRLGWDAGIIWRMVVFGWPIWLSAFPLVAVYQGERMIVGHLLGIEALAAFTVAFMVTMVPGVGVAKVSHALMLPLLSAARGQCRRFQCRVRLMSELTTLAAAAYAALFLIASDTLIPLAFGPAYSDLGPLAGCLGLMWALRMLQGVPGMALMALGVTRPLLVAGCVRAMALPAALWLALQGANLTMVASTGAIGELASLLYVSTAASTVSAGLGGIVIRRSLFLLPACAVAALVGYIQRAEGSVIVDLATVLGVSSALVMAACAVMPGFRRHVDLQRLRSIRSRRVAA